MICDFCSSPNIIASYPCKDFTVGDVFGSEGGWTVCEDCMKLIETGDRSRLLHRSAIKYFKVNFPGQPIPDELFRVVKNWIELLHEKFWENFESKEGIA